MILKLPPSRSNQMGSRESTLRFLAIGLGGLTLASYVVWRNNRIISSFKGKVVLITGGSSGLGLALARRFCAQGARVAILARDPAGLAQAKSQLEEQGGQVETLSCNLLDRNQTDAAIRQVVDHFGGLDVLVNNAGTIEVGPLEHMQRDDFERAMSLHFWAPFNLTIQAIPYFRKRGGGSIVNIASIGGKIAPPHLAPYCASKFALVGLSDAFRAELDQENIRVTTVTPGLMRTGSHVNARFKGDRRAEYKWFSTGATLPVISISAERAAEQIVSACRRGLPSLTIPFAARLMLMGDSIFPNISATIMKILKSRSSFPHISRG